MELTYSELKKRYVINIVDGKCLGRITDIKFRFPEGRIEGVMVPGKRTCSIFSAFNKSPLYIPEKRIIKIGGDVILVDLSCGEACGENVTINKKEREKKPCPPPCPPINPHSNEVPFFRDSENGESINFDEY